MRPRGTGTARTSRNAEELVCPSCATVIEGNERKYWKLGPDRRPMPVIHCEGSQAAYGCSDSRPHHVSRLWEPCWKCGSPMGCPICVGDAKGDSIYCERCMVAANLETLLEQGLPSGFTMQLGRGSDDRAAFIFSQSRRDVAPLSAYPKHWVVAYYQRCAALGYSCDDPTEPIVREVMAGVANLARGMIAPRGPSKMQLASEKERQRKALVKVEFEGQLGALTEEERERALRGVR